MMGLIFVLCIRILTFFDVYLAFIVLLRAWRQRLPGAVLFFISTVISLLQVTMMLLHKGLHLNSHYLDSYRSLKFPVTLLLIFLPTHRHFTELFISQTLS
jgi:hypothetical protein